MVPDPDIALITTTAARSPRRRGRPRSVEVDTRILEAAVEELGEGGVAGFTFERVAERASVARSTIYRRWPTKVELIIGSIELLRTRSPVPDTGDARADIEAGIDNMLRMFTSRHGRAIAAALVAQTHDDDLAQAWMERIAQPHQNAFRTVLRRGVETGQVRLSLDLDESVAVISGIAFMVLLGSVPNRQRLAADTVSMLFDGIAP